MVPNTPTRVYNMALGLLGQKPVADIVTTPQTSVEVTGQLWYDTIRRSLLMSYTPNFATKAEAIQRTGAPSIAAYSDIYAFPNDYLKLIAIQDDRLPLQNFKYMLTERDILINNGGESSLDVWFVYDVRDISKYPDNFTKLLVGELAVTVGPSVTKLASMIKMAEVFRDKARLEVLGSNGQMKPPIRYERSSIVNAGFHTPANVAGQHTFNFEPN